MIVYFLRIPIFSNLSFINFIKIFEHSLAYIESATLQYKLVNGDNQVMKILIIRTLQISYSSGKNFATTVNAIFFETSAKDGTNVEELFVDVGE